MKIAVCVKHVPDGRLRIAEDTKRLDRSGYFGYGLGWWVEAGSRGGQRPFLARGKYGQVVVVDPARDAVVVRLGSDDAGVDWKTVALDVVGKVDRYRNVAQRRRRDARARSAQPVTTSKR